MTKPKTTPIFNKPEQKQRRQTLRGHMPEPEKRLWQILRKEQLGVKFRRQHGIGDYVVDFYCPALKLVIEVDGDSHYSEQARNYDKVRDGYMRSLGIVTLRFNNNDVMKNLEGVYQQITKQLASRTGSQQEEKNG